MEGALMLTGGAPLAGMCSTVRTPSGLRAGRARNGCGQQRRSRSRGGTTASCQPSTFLANDESRGRSLTRIAVSQEYDECATDFIDGLFAEAVDDYADEAVRSVEELDNNNEAEAVDDDFDSNASSSVCGDYPDSELEEDAIGEEVAGQPRNDVFMDYMIEMFEAAFSGNVLELFEPGNTDIFGNPSCDMAAFDLPKASSLKPCSRPSFRKHLRPREVAPGAEEFPMDCLRSEAVCLSAPQGRSQIFWAERMQCAALVEELGKDRLDSLEDVRADAPLDDSLVPQETVLAPVPPSTHKPNGGTGSHRRSCQKTSHDPALSSTTPLTPSTPRTQANINTSVAPTPPEGPPPSTRTKSRPRSYFAAQANEVTEKSAHVVVKTGAMHTVTSQWESEIYASSLRKVLNVETTGNHAAHPAKSAMAMDLATAGNHMGPASKSAMAMDLGEMAVGDAVHASFVSEGLALSSSTKASNMLPPILQQTWGGVSTPRGKTHDIIY